jgi:hypothetical protein
VFSVVVHGDVEGAEIRRSISDWLCFMDLCPAGPTAELDRYIGYWKPCATSHAELDADTAIQEEVRNAARTLLEAVRGKFTGTLVAPGEKSAPAVAEIIEAPSPTRPVQRLAYKASFFIALTALAGPRQPRNRNSFDSSASVASKNFSSSSNAGSRPPARGTVSPRLVPLTITRRGFTAFFCSRFSARCQLLIVVGNPKHSAFRIRIGDVVSDSAGLFAALAAISHWTYPQAGRLAA